MKTLGYAKSRARLRSDPVDKLKDPKFEGVPSSGEPHANSSGGGFFAWEEESTDSLRVQLAGGFFRTGFVD
jgi:hypothetical protein